MIERYCETDSAYRGVDPQSEEWESLEEIEEEGNESIEKEIPRNKYISYSETEEEEASSYVTEEEPMHSSFFYSDHDSDWSD